MEGERADPVDFSECTKILIRFFQSSLYGLKTILGEIIGHRNWGGGGNGTSNNNRCAMQKP